MTSQILSRYGQSPWQPGSRKFSRAHIKRSPHFLLQCKSISLSAGIIVTFSSPAICIMDSSSSITTPVSSSLGTAAQPIEIPAHSSSTSLPTSKRPLSTPDSVDSSSSKKSRKRTSANGSSEGDALLPDVMIEHSISFRNEDFVLPFMVSPHWAAKIPGYTPRDCKLRFRPFGPVVYGFATAEIVSPSEWRLAESECLTHDIECPIHPQRRSVCTRRAVLVPAPSPPPAPTKPFPLRRAKVAADDQVARPHQEPAAASPSLSARESTTVVHEEELPQRKLVDDGYMSAPSSPPYRP